MTATACVCPASLHRRHAHGRLHMPRSTPSLSQYTILWKLQSQGYVPFWRLHSPVVPARGHQCPQELPAPVFMRTAELHQPPSTALACLVPHGTLAVAADDAVSAVDAIAATHANALRPPFAAAIAPFPRIRSCCRRRHCPRFLRRGRHRCRRCHRRRCCHAPAAAA